MAWEREGELYGVKTIAYSFPNHVQEGKNPRILTPTELDEGWEHVKIADKTLKKNVEGITSTYMRSLLCRNWFQVKNAGAIFAIGKFDANGMVSGGTGWAVQMAIDNQKPTYVFDQMNKMWVTFLYPSLTHLAYDDGTIPILTENFAGIGTRDLNDNGREAIRKIYYERFCQNNQR
jgi:hypothetical protein